MTTISQKIAQAYVDLYHCDGVSTRQHNGVYPLQEVFHYHFHIFPRYKGDELYALDNQSYRTIAEERRPYAEAIRDYLNLLKD